jgi:hypothetical protein
MPENNEFDDNHVFEFEQEEEQEQISGDGLQKMVNLYDVDHNIVSGNLVESLKSGQLNPIQFHLSLKRMEKIIELVGKNTAAKDVIMEEVRKNLSGNVKTVKMYGASLSVAATYTWYDFANCNDIYLERLKEIKDEVDALIKNREDELKLLIPKDNFLGLATATKVIDRLPSLTWTELGQDCVVSPPVKIQKEGVKVSFDKN